MTPQLPHEILGSAESFRVDRLAMESGISSTALMGAAAQALFARIGALCPKPQSPNAQKIVILCGAGNNGGDGYGLAALLAESGYETEIHCLAPPRTQEAQFYAQACASVPRRDFFSADAPAEAEKAALIVDALFGIGLSRPLEAAVSEQLARFDRLEKPVLAVDIGSGIGADDGRLYGHALHACETVTFFPPQTGAFSLSRPSQNWRIALRCSRRAAKRDCQPVRLDVPAARGIMARARARLEKP